MSGWVPSCRRGSGVSSDETTTPQGEYLTIDTSDLPVAEIARHNFEAWYAEHKKEQAMSDKLTQTEIAALPDAELVRLVAEKVMGWHRAAGPVTCDMWTNKDGLALYPIHGGKCWSPLTDWSHTMMVVAVMRAKGFGFELDTGYTGEDQFAGFYRLSDAEGVIVPIPDLSEAAQRRAILEAAYTAM